MSMCYQSRVNKVSLFPLTFICLEDNARETTSRQPSSMHVLDGELFRAKRRNNDIYLIGCYLLSLVCLSLVQRAAFHAL